MKLIVQADDYAISDAVAEGILKCARDGILTQTGLMSNGEHAAYYARRMLKENPHVSLGQEINLVSGRPLCPSQTIPTLVNEEGRLLRSGEHRMLDQKDPAHVCYEDAYHEIKAQIDCFLEIVGQKPCFIGLHSYQNNTMLQALSDLKREYAIDGLEELAEAYAIDFPKMGPWYPFVSGVEHAESYEYQLSFDAVEMFLNGACDYISGHEKEDRICMFHTHAGFVDKKLLDMSTLTMTRLIELELLCSDEMKEWVRQNQVELTNMRNLKVKMRETIHDDLL